MKIQVTVNNVIIQEKNILNEHEYNVHECEFEFVEEYNGLTKKAVFTGIDGRTYVQTIVDDKCYIPSEILAKRQNVKIGVYGYDVDNEELILRYSPRPTEFTIHEGSYKEGENTTPPTPSEIEQLQAQITSNKNDIEEIQGDIVDINGDITDIKAEQTEQNTKIQNNTDNISTINGQIVTINADIENLERTKADKTEIPTKTSDLINDSDFVSDANYVHTDNNFTNEKDAQITTNTSNITTLQSTKADKTEIPTKTSQLTNDSGYITKNVDDLANYYKKSETYNKTEIDGKVSSVYKYKGTVATYEDLPSTGLTIGDVYNVESDGSNYAWTGNAWDKLGGDIDLSEYYTKTQTDSLLSAKANSSEVYTKNETYNKTEVNTLLNDKVDKVDGKGLSTEDFTTAKDEKLQGIENEANKTVVDSEMNSTSTNPVENQVIYASQEVQNARISELEQDVEDLRGACYKVEGTGTDITLNNTAKGRLLKNELSGRTEQEQLSGKNLFNKNDVNIANGWINENGYPNGSTEYNQKTSGFIPVIAGEKYTQSSYNSNNYIAFYDENKAFIQGSRVALSSGTHTAPSGAYYMRTNYFLKNTDTFQVEQGSTATDYEEYCGGIPSPNPDFPQQIKNVTGNANVKIQNKNLAWNGWAEDFVSRVNSAAAGIVHDRYERKNVLFYADNTGYGDYENKYIFKTDFKENTQYTFNFDYLKKSNTNGTLAIQYTDGSTTKVTNVSGLEIWENKILVSSPNKTIKYVRAQYAGGTGYIDLDTFMVLEGVYTAETIPDYFPHQEQNYPFTFAEGQRAMQGTTLENDGIHNVRKQIIFDGSNDESWDIDGSSSSRTIFRINVADIESYSSSSAVPNILATHFIVVSQNATWKAGDISRSSGTTYLFVIMQANMTISDFREWLSNNNVTVEYGLAEEEIIPYNSTQQTQYNAIKNARSYDDITYITSTSDELGFNINVESLGNINTVINNLLNN